LEINLHPESGYNWTTFLENTYFEKVIEELFFILGDRYNDYFFQFYLYDGTLKQNIAPPKNIVKIKVLFLLCDERNHLNHEHIKGYDYVFKSYLPDGHCSSFIPIPVGYNAQIPKLPIKNVMERGIDVFYSGNLNSNRLTGLYKSLHKLSWLPKRLFLAIYARPRIRKLFNLSFPIYFQSKIYKYNISFNDGFNLGLKKSLYADALNNCKIALCPKGYFVNETFRFYEALRQGAIVVSERLPNHSFYKDAPVLQTETWNDLPKIIKQIYIKNMEEQQKASLNYYEANLSEMAVAQYVKKIIVNFG